MLFLFSLRCQELPAEDHTGDLLTSGRLTPEPCFDHVSVPAYSPKTIHRSHQDEELCRISLPYSVPSFYSSGKSRGNRFIKAELSCTADTQVCRNSAPTRHSTGSLRSLMHKELSNFSLSFPLRCDKLGQGCSPNDRLLHFPVAFLTVS